METIISLVILIASIILLKMKLPVDTNCDDSSNNMPTSKKKYSFIFNMGIVALILCWAISITIGLLLIDITNFDSTFIYSLMFFSLGWHVFLDGRPHRVAPTGSTSQYRTSYNQFYFFCLLSPVF